MRSDKVFKGVFLFLMIVPAACQSRTSVVPSPTATLSPIKTFAQQPTVTESATLSPVRTIPASTVERKGAEVPPGFSLIMFADLYRPTGFAFDAEGKMYATSQDGNVYLLIDSDKDGRVDSRFTFATGYYFPVGVAVHHSTGEVYVSYQGQ